MFNGLPFLLFVQTPAPSNGIDVISIVNSFGWQVGIFIMVVSTLLVVIRQRSQNAQVELNARIAQQARDDEFREAQEKARNELQLRHDTLMNETRLQMLDERNKEKDRNLLLMEQMQKLSVQIIEAQQSTIKMQNNLDIAKRSEIEAKNKAIALENELAKLRQDLEKVQAELVEAKTKIDALIVENKTLESKVQRISTGTVPKVTS